MKVLGLTIAFALGLYFFRNNIAFSIIISLLYLLFIFFRFNKRYLALISIVFIGGIMISNLNLSYNNKDDIYSGMVVEVKENYFIFLSHYEKFYVYEENTDKEFGDYLTISSKPSVYKYTSYESQFDFGAYLKDKGVTRSLNLKEYHYDYKNPIRVHQQKEIFLNKFDDDAKALINSLLFLEKDYSSNAISSFEELNLLYLISLSGIYLYFLFKLTTYLFGLFTPKKIAELIPLILYSPLLIFSFPRVSILRIFLIRLLRLVNERFLKKRLSYLTLLSSLALFFLIIDYHLVYQQSYYVGFLLSLLGIYARNCLNLFSKKKTKWFLKIYPLVLLIPIHIQSNNTFHVFSPIFQILMSSFFLILLMMSLICLSKIPMFSLTSKYASFLVGISKSLQRFDLQLPIMVNEWFIAIFYVLIFALIYLLESQRIKHLKNTALALASLFVISLVPVNAVSSGVYFINVGQGDSILLKDHNKTVLLDTGGNLKFDMAKETLIPFFRKIGVRHIDLLITSHDDYDHSGAANSLIENFRVYEYRHYREEFPYQIGKINLKNLNYYNGDENDSSLVFMIDFMNKKWLLTGDASIETEKWLINSGEDLDCDILKVGHHGSKTSSCEQFIVATSPSEAIISCGGNNRYGHPNQEVIDRLNKHNIKIRRTDLEGTISYVSIFS